MAFNRTTKEDNDGESKGSGLVKLGALWQTPEDSKLALSGVLGDANLLIFPNKYKKEENHPDFIVYVAAKQKKEDTSEDVPF